MSHGLPATDEMHRLIVEAKEALSRVEFTNKDWFWLRRIGQRGHRRTSAEPHGDANTGVSLALDARERRLIIEALRKSLGPESSEVPFRAEVGGPMSLTPGEWSSIREELLRHFFEIGGEHTGHVLARVVTRIEDLIAFEQAPDVRTEGQAGYPRLSHFALQRPKPRGSKSRTGATRRVRRSRPFRFPGPRIGTLRELGLAMLLDDEGPLPTWMLHADETLLASLADRGVIAVQPGSGERNAVWMLTAEGRIETQDCRRRHLDWLGRVHAKNPVWHRTVKLGDTK